MTRYAVSLLCLVLGSCATASAGKPQAVEPGAEFTLAPGEMAAVKSGRFKVRFVAVTDDTRCPQDTACVWAGEVKAQIDVLKISQTMQVELRVGETAVRGDYRLTLLRVEPLPVSTAKIAPQDYRVTLKLDPAN